MAHVRRKVIENRSEGAGGGWMKDPINMYSSICRMLRSKGYIKTSKNPPKNVLMIQFEPLVSCIFSLLVLYSLDVNFRFLVYVGVVGMSGFSN